MRYPVTMTLIAINAIAFVWELTTGGFETRSLYAHGALCGICVRQGGEWWRIFTSAFLHAGFQHIAFNMFALFSIGTEIESYLGSWRTLAIYLIALIGGGLGVVYFGAQDAVTVGASGAIFGLFGALVAYGLRLRERGKQIVGRALPTILINLVFTFAIPFISKEDHIGGLISGFLAGLIFFAMRVSKDPVVVDTETGESAPAEYIAPDEPNGPARAAGVP